MAYLRKENETVEIDYPLDKVWSVVPKALASLEWTIEETDDTKHHIKAKTKGAFMSYPSRLIIDAVAVDKKTARCKVTAETPVTTITSIADFGRTRDRIDLFFEALANQLTSKKTSDNTPIKPTISSRKETTKHENTKRNEKKPLKNAAKIKVSKNGPYLVSGKIPLQKQIIIADSEGTATEWQPSTKYTPQEKYALCRCGHSKNKPFCDGTHTKVKFDGSETAGDEAYLNQPKEIDGPTLKLEDTEELCASARFCHRAGGIWKLVPASDDPAKKQIVIEETCDCPSGRLVILDKETGKIIEPKFSKSIGLIEDPAMGVSGPIWVRGGVPVESADGKIYRVRNRVTLCRCGKSKNKPFCDSSHYPEAETVEKVHKE